MSTYILFSFPCQYDLKFYFNLYLLTNILLCSTFSGVDPNTDYPTLYRYFVEVWIYLGLAWLSLFFNWKVRMVVEAHKALKKRRKRRKISLEEFKESPKSLRPPPTSKDVNIFSFLSKRQEGYSDLIKQMGSKNGNGAHASSTAIVVNSKAPNRSKSCSDTPVTNGNTILNLDRSPRQKRRYSFSDRVTVAFSKSKNYLLGQESGLLLNEVQNEGDMDDDQERMYENQLDKEAGENHRGQGMCSFNSSRHTSWDSKDYQAVPIFQTANITFIDEENLHCNMDECSDTKAKLSVTTDENADSETDSKEEDSDSEESVFTTDGSDNGHSYEKLVEEYSKEDNTEP